MRFSRILEQVYCKPWWIMPEAHLSIGKTVQRIFEKDTLESLSRIGFVESAGRGKNILTGQSLPQMTVKNGTAIIPLHGVMARGVDMIEKSCGITDVEDVRRDIDEAEASDEVKRVIFDIDSPGGMHNGSAELAYRAAAMSKETIAWTAGSMGSAAYFFGCSCDSIWAAPSASVGSIGSYIAMLDESRAYEMQGYKVELFKGGEFKGTGMPGTSLTDSQRGFIQGIVDQATAQFQAHVKSMRPNVKAESMDGRHFFAAEAYSRGLIDGQANSLSDLLKMFR